MNNDSQILPFFLFSTFLIVAFVLAIVSSLIIQKQKQVKNKLAQQRLTFDYEQALLNTRIEVRESTLNMLSQELHDNIMQAMTGCYMEVSMAKEFVHEEGRYLIEHAKTQMLKIVSDVRLLSHSLASGMVENRELDEAIQAELNRIQAFTNINCTLISNSILELSPNKRLLVFRVVQEALQNIIKHAAAKHIKVLTDDNGDLFSLRIMDDGIGFNTATIFTGKSCGLSNISERAKQLKGAVTITSQSNTGTEILLEIPLNPTNGTDTNSNC